MKLSSSSCEVPFRLLPSKHPISSRAVVIFFPTLILCGGLIYPANEHINQAKDENPNYYYWSPGNYHYYQLKQHTQRIVHWRCSRCSEADKHRSESMYLLASEREFGLVFLLEINLQCQNEGGSDPS